MRIEKSYWFTLSKFVYVSFNSKAPMLLYNTQNGESIVVTKSTCMDIVNKVYEPMNLGVVEIEPANIEKDVLDFIEEAIDLEIGKRLGKSISSTKPINLLPILNLQNDVEKLISNGETHLIGDHISNYLTSLSFYITNDCNEKCKNCSGIFRQTTFCTKAINGNHLSLDRIKSVLDQSAATQLKKINVMGGDISLYPKWNELLDLLKQYSMDCHFWFHFLHLHNLDLEGIPGHKEILVSYPFDKGLLEEALSKFENRQDFTFHFLIESNQVFEAVNDLLCQYDQLNYNLVPYYNGENIDFINQNVFLDETDILSEKIEMRKIFCNQKLNSNFFGSLYVFPDGAVKSSSNTPKIGRFPDNSLLELIYNELIRNTVWRKVRSGEKCDACMYRFLCPPPGNLEFVLEKQDLCHVVIKSEEELQVFSK